MVVVTRHLTGERRELAELHEQLAGLTAAARNLAVYGAIAGPQAMAELARIRELDGMGVPHHRSDLDDLLSQMAVAQDALQSAVDAAGAPFYNYLGEWYLCGGGTDLSHIYALDLAYHRAAVAYWRARSRVV